MLNLFDGLSPPTAVTDQPDADLQPAHTESRISGTRTRGFLTWRISSLQLSVFPELLTLPPELRRE